MQDHDEALVSLENCHRTECRVAVGHLAERIGRRQVVERSAVDRDEPDASPPAQPALCVNATTPSTLGKSRRNSGVRNRSATKRATDAAQFTLARMPM